MGNALQEHVFSIPRGNRYGINIFLVKKEGFWPSFFFKCLKFVRM
jgi:hypothetical protein